MKTAQFIGREAEMARLKGLLSTRSANLITLYLCEVKFKKDKIGKNILEAMEEKRKRLKVPRHFSIRPVLIHVNGVEDSVVEENYFDKIIDFSQLLS